jgi:hypothetical protein
VAGCGRVSSTAGSPICGRCQGWPGDSTLKSRRVWDHIAWCHIHLSRRANGDALPCQLVVFTNLRTHNMRGCISFESAALFLAVSCMCSVGCQQHALTFPLGNHVLVSITHHRALLHGMTTIRVTEPQKATILGTTQTHTSYHHRNAHGDLVAQNRLIRRAERNGD